MKFPIVVSIPYLQGLLDILIVVTPRHITAGGAIVVKGGGYAKSIGGLFWNLNGPQKAVTLMRDWQKDWELSQAATLGPWVMTIDGYGKIVGVMPDIEVVHDGCIFVAKNPDRPGFKEDCKFIAESRTALPYWLQRVKELEAEVNEHRERANDYQTRWEAHKMQDCAIRCAKEIEGALGTIDPVKAARVVRKLKAIAKAAEDILIHSDGLLDDLEKGEIDSVYTVRGQELLALAETLAALEGDGQDARA